MSVIGWIIGIIFVAGIVVAGCVALANDEDAYGPVRIVVASHDYDGCWEGECYSYDERSGGYGDDRGGDGRYAGGRSGDMEQGDGRNCRNFCDNVIYIPDPRGEERQR